MIPGEEDLLRLAMLAASVTGWSHAELMDMEIGEVLRLVSLASDAGFLERKQ